VRGCWSSRPAQPSGSARHVGRAGSVTFALASLTSEGLVLGAPGPQRRHLRLARPRALGWRLGPGPRQLLQCVPRARGRAWAGRAMVSVGVSWCQLVSVGVSWCQLMSVGVSWCQLMSVGCAGRGGLGRLAPSSVVCIATHLASTAAWRSASWRARALACCAALLRRGWAAGEAERFPLNCPAQLTNARPAQLTKTPRPTDKNAPRSRFAGGWGIAVSAGMMNEPGRLPATKT
jgi:hypothetical protein